MTPGQVELELCGVVHLVRPAGAEVRDLEELRVALRQVPERSLFFHSAGRMLRHPASAELPHDDVSAWVGGVVQDRETAERLSFAVENAAPSAAELREALGAVLDGLSERQRRGGVAPAGGEFVFLAAESVVVPSRVRVRDAETLLEALAAAEPSVWFYHLIEQPWFAPPESTLFEWLRHRGEEHAAEWMEQQARSGRALDEIARRVLRRWRLRGLGPRIAAAAQAGEGARREVGREAISRLVRRLHRADEDA